jgi:uncharacterized RDD family membrane protein YckC
VTLALDRVQRTAGESARAAPAVPIPDQPYAGIVTRAIAFAIDAAIIDAVAVAVGAIVALVLSILPTSHNERTVFAAVGAGLFVLWSIAYFVTFWTTTGQTPGNHVMRIRVQRDQGPDMKPRHAILRLIGIVAGLPLFWGYVPILITARRRGFQDVLAGTVVVNTVERADVAASS